MHSEPSPLPELDSYPLSPMQAGMLYESLLYADAAGTTAGGFNVEQIHVELESALDAKRLARAFNHVALRHPVLRAGFAWEGQSVRMRIAPNVEVPVTVTPPSEALDWEEFLATDRQRGFDLRRPPLMRATLVPRGAATHLVWTFHHILLDGRSFAQVLLEVFRVYDALTAGALPALAPAPRPYTDYLRWLASYDTAPAHRYFADLLAGKVTPTALPTAEPSGRPLPGVGYGEHCSVLDTSALDSVRSLARSTATTVGTVIHAAWALVLARFCREDDVVFGSTRAGRRSVFGADTDEMVGLFINTLPVRVTFAPESTVADVLADVRMQSIALREHEHAPLSMIQAASEMPRGLALFDTLVMFENQELNQTLERRGGAVWKSRRCHLHEQPSLPLSVTVFESDQLEFRLLYDRRRFTPGAIDRLASAMRTAVQELSRDPLRRIEELDVLAPDLRHRILSEWNATERTFAEHLRIHELFEQRVASQPDAIALECDGHALSYAALDDWANRVAHHLVERGAAPGTFVGVCLSRGLSLVAALLAVAKSGAAYVPLDPDYPAERLAFMLEDTRAPLVVTERQYRSLFDCPVAELDGEHTADIARRPSTRPAPSASSHDVCYAIFTSGSTGKPKGVVLTHHAVVNTLDWVNRSFKVGPGDRLLFVTSPCFDLSVYDVFGALGAGATVVVATARQLKDPELLTRTLVAERITIWDSAPAALQRLVPFFPQTEVAQLRLVMLSGDWIPLSLPDTIRRAFPGCEVKSLGGATEAAIWSNWYPIGAIEPRWTSVPYGRPIQNSRYHVLDQALRPVPVGVPGDLYIGGTCLAQGYLNRPELTQERFIPDPFRAGTHERLYKTGDLARYFEDGNLEFLGRADFQVKIRGFRVEMGEVEVAISETAGVREVVCSTYVDASGQKALVAYVVPAAGERLDTPLLKRELGKKLPDFMVPSYVVELPYLPLSANGKVDRKALPSPTDVAPTSGLLAPRNKLEGLLLEVWRQVLGRSVIGIRDNFFELGGHSLLAVVLMAEIKRKTGIDVPLSRIINCPTIELLAQSLDPKKVGSAAPPTLPPNVVILHAGGPRSLFLIHDGDGEVLLYLTLARLLPRSFTVYGVQPKTQPGVPMAHLSIVEMASFYLEQIKQVQPEGPYHLGGLCAGGVISFEVARQLGQRGDAVATVALLDAVEPTAPLKRFRTAKRRITRVRQLWRRTLGLDGVPPSTMLRGQQHHVLGSAAHALSRKVANVIRYELAARAHEVSAQTRLKLLAEVLQRGWAWPSQVPPLSVRQIYAAARDSYRPGPATIQHVLLLKATQGVDADEPAGALTEDPLLGWHPYVQGRLEAVEVRGGHSSMLQEPYVHELAGLLEQCLDPVSTPPSQRGRSTPPSALVDEAPRTVRAAVMSSRPPLG